MIKIIIWQTIMLFASVVISGYFWDHHAVWSAVWGGLSYLIPSIISIVSIVAMKKVPSLLPMSLLIAELIKMVLSTLMILLGFIYYPAVNVFALLVGLILVSQAGLFTFVKKYHHERH